MQEALATSSGVIAISKPAGAKALDRKEFGR